MSADKFMEYEQAMVDYEELSDYTYCCFPLDIGKVEIFMSEASCERGIYFRVFVDKKINDVGIFNNGLFEDELGDFEYDLCAIDVLRYVKQRFQESDLIINT